MRASLGYLLFALGTLPACSSNDHPSNIHDAGAGGEGGTGSNCQPKPDMGVSVSGDVITYDGLLNKGSYTGKAEIKMPGAPCGWSSATWDSAAPPDVNGKNLFTVENVLNSTENFAHLYPLDTPGYYPTLIKFVSTEDVTYEQGFGLVNAPDVDGVYAATGVTYDPASFGTVIVQTLDPQAGTPSWGVGVSAGASATVATSDVSGWKLGGETDQQGIAVLLNAKGKSFPGMSLSITVTAGSQKQSFKCPVEKGAVTVCWIGIGSAPT